MSVGNLEERVETLETKFSELEQLVKPSDRDALKTFGMFEHDPLFDEMSRLGREYREGQPDAQDEC